MKRYRGFHDVKWRISGRDLEVFMMRNGGFHEEI